MGTNYYFLNFNFPDKTIYKYALNSYGFDSILHIGKCSFGWRFLFQSYSVNDDTEDKFNLDKNLNSFDSWFKYIRKFKHGIILNEYKDVISIEDLYTKIINTKVYELTKYHDMTHITIDSNGFPFTDREFS